MEYTQVPPPSQSTPAQNTAFADALARAREIAAKIGGSTPAASAPPADSQPLKRPYEGVGEPQPDAKKMASLNDPIGAQLKALADQQRAQQAVAAAANAAAQINAKLGISNNAPAQQPAAAAPQPPIANSMPGMGMSVTENYSVPDRMVGLVIGKGGENIAAIQSETGVKVQFAQDSGGAPDRPCTLTGSVEDIQRAKDYIGKIITKGQGLPDNNSMSDGVTMEEVMIPGNKVGLVIGKGGETIKTLQEKAGVKMVMIQDSNAPTAVDKPLRITGEPSRVAQAKEMVFDLLAEKEALAVSYGNEYAARHDFVGNAGKQDVSIPRNLVGVVIGKGGDMIKRITQETGARLQLKPDDGQGPDRVCMVMGSPEKVQGAVEFINNLLEGANTRVPGQMGRGRGRPGGPGGDDRRPGGFGQQKDDTTFIVPADKTGLVIGKGGETVKDINRQSGAWVELSRDRPPNPHDRVFKINGMPDQIQHAIRLICEKAGLPPPSQNNRAGGGGGPGGPPQGFGGYDQNYQPSNGSGPPQAAAPQGWGNAYNQWNQPQQSEQRPPEQNPAAWAQYYNYYGQNNQQQQQPQQPPQPQQQPQQSGHQQQPQQQQQAAQAPRTSQSSLNPVTGQPDYSAQWADYYRQQGMHYHAEAILQQAAVQQAAAQQQQAAAPQ